MVFHAVDAVEGERAEQGVAGHRLAHAGHGGGVLVAQQVPAQARLGALGVLELHDAHALDGILAHAEEAGGHLRDHVVVVGPQAVGVSALAGAGEGVPRHGRAGFAQDGVDAHRPEAHAAAIDRHVDMDLRPAVVAVVQVQAGVDSGRRCGRCASSSRDFELEAEAVEPAARCSRGGIPDAAARVWPVAA